MEFNLPESVPEYRCPFCGGKVVKALVEDNARCVHEYQWTCRGEHCHRTFAPPWTERLWGESDPPTRLDGMQLWLQPEHAVESVLPITQAMLSRKPTAAELLRWLTAAIFALPAGSMVIAVLMHELLGKTARALTHTLI